MKRNLICLVVILNLIGVTKGYASHHDRVKQGAIYFMDHCSGCHTLRYLRYSPLLKKLDITSWLNDEASEVPIKISMPRADAIHWFGRLPPDLSLVIASRGQAWVSEYLKGFYPDETRPFGVNHHLIPNVMMPQPLTNIENPDEVIEDIIAFLTEVAEPSKLDRYYFGVFVIVLLLGLIVIM